MTTKCMFKIRAVFYLLFCALSCFAKGENINEYSIYAQISNDTLLVSLELDIAEDYQHKMYFLFFDECEIRNVEVNDSPALFWVNNDTLWITEQDKVASLKIEYKVSLSLPRFADAVILKRESRWYPHRKDELFKYELTITDTSQYIITNGLKEGDTYFSDTTNEIHLLLLDKYEYELITVNTQNTYFNFFRHKNDSAFRVDFFYNEFTNAFDFFCSYFDDSKQKSAMNVVEIYDSTFVMCQSLENLILFGNVFVADIQDNSLCSWIAHETAHQWWGNRIFFKEGKMRLFLEESLAEYLKMQYIQYQHRLKGFNCIKNVYENNMSWLDSVIPISDIQDLYSTESCIVVYTQIPYLLNEVFNMHSEINFRATMSEFYHKYYRKFVSFEDFYYNISDTQLLNILHTVLFLE